MNGEFFASLLEEKLAGTQIILPYRALLYPVARAIPEMGAAYLADGRSFSRKGDLVNGIGCFCYGLGWLDAGVSLGLLTAKPAACRYGSWRVAALPDHLAGHLAEKSTRYERLLSLALDAVEVSPERESPLSLAGERIHLVSSAFLREGRRSQGEGDRPRALALFSYGHGWLDTGVRSGLFRVLAHREIFAL
ncbi:MAG: DUF357 domain-containing protein [Methanoregulaceae archaeon]